MADLIIFGGNKRLKMKCSKICHGDYCTENSLNRIDKCNSVENMMKERDKRFSDLRKLHEIRENDVIDNNIQKKNYCLTI